MVGVKEMRRSDLVYVYMYARIVSLHIVWHRVRVRMFVVMKDIYKTLK